MYGPWGRLMLLAPLYRRNNQSRISDGNGVTPDLIELNTISFISSLPQVLGVGGQPLAAINDSWQGMPPFELESSGTLVNIRYCKF